jgi:FdhD protein
MSDGAVSFEYYRYNDGDWEEIEAEVIEEGAITIFANGQELATLMCTPRDALQLALGFCANEGLIDGMADVEIAHVCKPGTCVDLWFSHLSGTSPAWIITRCGGGHLRRPDAFQEPLQSDLSLPPEQVGALIGLLQDQHSLYARARGVHTSALSDGQRLVIVAEDVGRHNTLDRLRGECLLKGIDPRGMLLLSTGRISSEMIHKAVKMGCPIVASRTSPTSVSVTLARAWNITLCGYVRRNRMNVYSHLERLVPSDAPSYIFKIEDVAGI